MFWFLGLCAFVLPLLAFVLACAGQGGLPLRAARNARYWGLAAALLALLAVMADAYITHAVGGGADSVPAVAAHYQMTHALALIALAVLAGLQKDRDEPFASLAGWLFCIGIMGFCGGLFLRAAGMPSFAGIAPFGGTCLMLGWLAFAVSLYRRLKS